MINAKYILYFFGLISLISCESFIRFNGNVYNSENEPISDAKITVLLRKNDTIKKVGFELDTILSEEREKLRKNGIKDDFYINAMGEYYKPKVLFTDKNGFFKTRTILIPCGFKCPKVNLIVEKEKNKKVILLDNKLKRDSMKIILD
ncbi:hypothetical protein ACTS9U_10580 [Empedobacter falsenii]|uniref:hypothetical protein n=1 Tax=Empedobacter TaxID=59734 RepID=UPI002449692F|nr:MULTISPECIES: hypothetical protein [Empedobacter]MDH1883929.1 hypothetical protein [Empedobacter sp. GD03797]MDM1041582.1 hypothetical protein [Empedobacter brevis]MDM1135284.1 hypothetical protein [Empedobacter sp. R750]